MPATQKEVQLHRNQTNLFLSTIGFRRGGRIWFRISWDLPLALIPKHWRVKVNKKKQKEPVHYVAQGNITQRGFTLVNCKTNGKDRNGNYRWVPSGKTHSDGWAYLYQLSNTGATINFYPNQPQQGISNNQVPHSCCLFYEIDKLSLENQQRKLDQLIAKTKLQPAAVVHSGGRSLHVYFRCKTSIPAEQWTLLNKRLSFMQDGDPAISNLGRSMRLPGMVRHTAESLQNPAQVNPAVVDLKQWSTHRYRLEDFDRVLPELPSLANPSPLLALQKEIQQPRVTKSPEPDSVPLLRCLTAQDKQSINQGAVQGNRNNAGYRLARNLLGTAQFLTSRNIKFHPYPYELYEQFCQRCSPPIDTQESDTIWKSATRNSAYTSLGHHLILARVWQHLGPG